MRSSVIVETIPRFGTVYKDMGEIKTAHKKLLKIDLLKSGRRNSEIVIGSSEFCRIGEKMALHVVLVADVILEPDGFIVGKFPPFVVSHSS